MDDELDRLGPRGRRLWDALAAADPNRGPHLAELALSVCRVADRLERLDQRCAAGPKIQTDDGWVLNPAYVEARKHAELLRQLIAALRLPDKNGRRPQWRGPRGVHQSPRSES